MERERAERAEALYVGLRLDMRDRAAKYYMLNFAVCVGNVSKTALNQCFQLEAHWG